ncbi:class I adenylate-forming enzyme family protein [Azospirillum melinis]|nr:AMP-binding protein [Azospirillum melinis]MBP2307560.1 fatty-acyl-CoA synthase [Azospirillum melinis]
MSLTTGMDRPAAALVARAAASTVGSLFLSTARLYPHRIAIEDDGQDEVRILTFAQLAERVNRSASALAALGVTRGARVAVLSENRLEYIETQLACALLGAITACQNWRLSPRELEHCIGLVAPTAILVSPRHAGILSDAATAGIPVIRFGAEWERRLASASADTPPDVAEPEDPLLILYTSGTTGLPKGAVLTHRSQLARMTAAPFDLGVRPGNTNLCWPPLYHMGGTEPAHYALLTGGRVIVLDAFDPDRIADKIETERFEWVSIMPGTLGRMIEVLERRDVRPLGLRTCGVMADLSPPAEVARLSELLGADFLNCFGSTETGTPPLSGRQLPRGATGDLGKAPSVGAEIRLVDPDDVDVPDGGIGELAMRGPTLFSGYWNNEAATRQDFRNGWFHMGDLLRRRPDGLYDFVDRAKYMIKSGGENIYPAEIERVLVGHPDVRDAVVVRRKDDRWGEIPVAVVVSANPRLEAAELSALCRRELAGFKQPKAIHFVPPERIVRSTTGKVQRGAIESWVESWVDSQTVEPS